MVTQNSGACTCYRIFTDSNRTSNFRTIYYFIIRFETLRMVENNTALTKVHIILMRTNIDILAFVIATIPSISFLANSNITGNRLIAINIIIVISISASTTTNSYIFIIRCRISSHRRSHACTGHNTCCNQHCQQLFGRAAFSSMAFCHFGNNDICVARFTPNYFEYFVHKKHLTHKYYYLYTVRNTCHVWKQVKQLFQ